MRREASQTLFWVSPGWAGKRETPMKLVRPYCPGKNREALQVSGLSLFYWLAVRNAERTFLRNELRVNGFCKNADSCSTRPRKAT
jgi:hypothetical protein